MRSLCSHCGMVPQSAYSLYNIGRLQAYTVSHHTLSGCSRAHPYLALSTVLRVGTPSSSSMGCDPCRSESVFLSSFLSHTVTHLGIHNNDYFGSPSSVSSLRIEETENENIEEHSRHLWHFCRRCARTHVLLIHHTAHVHSRTIHRTRMKETLALWVLS